ncbi:hypothetical protein D3C86_368820 [compost metagenome]
MILTPVPASPPAKAPIVRLTQSAQAKTSSMPIDRWVSQAPVIPDPPANPPKQDPWREVPETVASSTLHSVGAGVVGALLGTLVGGPVGAAIGAGVGTALGQGFMQLLLGMADGSNSRHRLGAAVPGALAVAGGVIGGMTVGAMGVTVGVLAAPLLALAGYGLFKGWERLK